MAARPFESSVWAVVDPSDVAEPVESPSSVTAPPVRVVMVAHQPGDWFTEALTSVGSQDYPGLEVTVLVAEGSEDVEQRVLESIPDATVRVVPDEKGYGRTANLMLDDEATPAFYLFCHDDVALAPDAVRLLVEEAIRSNASVVGPKLVRWSQPEQLLEVGLDVDKLGHLAPRVEVGELDQEQHDAVSDVFAISGAVQLVRADLFRALEGFDRDMGAIGENVDFCWRAHVSGARVMVVPSAVARHRTGMVDRRSDAAVELLRERHRVRTLLSVYGIGHSLRVVPQGLLYALIRGLGALLTGTSRLPEQRCPRGPGISPGRHRCFGDARLLRSSRKLRDGEIRRLQVGGFAPVSHFLRGSFHRGGWRVDRRPEPQPAEIAANRPFENLARLLGHHVRDDHVRQPSLDHPPCACCWRPRAV